MLANYITGNTDMDTRRRLQESDIDENGEYINSSRRLQENGEILYNDVHHRRLMGDSEYLETGHTCDLIVDDVSLTRPVKGKWDTAYSKVACCNGLFTFEIELTSITNDKKNAWDIQMGFMPRWTIYKNGSIVMNSCIGSLDGEGHEHLGSRSCDGYGYMQQNGGKTYARDSLIGEPYGDAWSQGDKVKGVANFYTGEIEFFLNGVSQGVAFTDIGVSPMVYAISQTAKSEITLLSATCNGEDIGPPVCNVPEWCQLQRGDGVCHAATNNEGCSYDDGDCCEETCVGEKCGQQWGYDCRNPLYNPYAKTCAENSQIFGDGLCHDAANNEGCGYDGGDCCEETCVGDNCGAWGYTCRDPSVIG
jgi:hypothetical protein